jgi:DNA-binding XRE family transcriptional regulator
MTLGAKLIQLREHKGLTQEELTATLQKRYKDCSISRNDIANWEVNRHCPRWPKAKVLCKYFGITLDDLFFDHKTQFLKSPKSLQIGLKIA